MATRSHLDEHLEVPEPNQRHEPAQGGGSPEGTAISQPGCAGRRSAFGCFTTAVGQRTFCSTLGDVRAWLVLSLFATSCFPYRETYRPAMTGVVSDSSGAPVAGAQVLSCSETHWQQMSGCPRRAGYCSWGSQAPARA